MTASRQVSAPRAPSIVMLDLLATVPYYTAYLSRALLAMGVPLRVASITYYLDPKCFSSRSVKLQPGCMNVVGGFALPRGPRRLLKLLELALNLSALQLRFAVRRPAVIHIQFLPLIRWPLPLDLWFLLFWQRRGTKLVLTVHDLLPHDTADKYREVFKRVYGHVDRLICHSDHVLHRLESEFEIPASKIAVIPHGPFFYDLPANSMQDLRTGLKIGSNHKIVLWQGIIFPYKGLDILLACWQRVEQECSAAYLVVLGTGAPDLLTQVRETVATLGLERVTLDLRFASSEELVNAYRAADVVVYPYRAITTSGALATGLALGKAIVASDLPVFRELLTGGESALLVPAGDAETLAQAIVALLNNDALRRRIVERVTRLNFGSESWRSIAGDTLKVYETVLKGEQETS